MPKQSEILISRARQLRTDQTSAEKVLWSRLRNRQLGGCKFVRQHPIGGYISDLCCREHHLIIEVDGATHSTDLEIEKDRTRTEKLKALGFAVLRFHNAEIYEDLEDVLETILCHLQGRNHL